MAGSFEQINGHVRLICPGCSAEGSIEVTELEKGRTGGNRP